MNRTTANNNMLVDSIALASVKVFTMGTSILATMVLSRTLPLSDYGTYSTGNLMINTATLISAFGLIDAVNYYYNGTAVQDREDYINTVFLLFTVCGAIAAGVILSAQGLITRYFHNPKLGAIYAYIAFRPFLQNFSSGLQNLQISIGKARAVAIRNAAVSISKLSAVLLASFYTRNIATVFLCMLGVEIAAMLFYYRVLWDNGVRVRPFQPDWSKVKEILIFCVPMGIYIQTNSLSRDLDKFVIGFFESTEKLAVYTNCSAKLPFDLVSGPLLTLLIPLLTRCIREDDFKNGADLFRCYLKIGYIFTFAFGLGCIAAAPQAVQLLYGPKYLEGVPIFTIYILVDMIHFISYSLVLAAKGRTGDLMRVSCGALVVNLALNPLLYQLMGLIGPAVATVIVTSGANAILLAKSAEILKENITALFDGKHVLLYGLQASVLSAALRPARVYLEQAGLHYAIIFAAVGGAFVGAMLLLNRKEIKKTFALLNRVNRRGAK